MKTTFPSKTFTLFLVLSSIFSAIVSAKAASAIDRLYHEYGLKFSVSDRVPGLHEDSRRYLVSEVKPDSYAENSGIAVGDVFIISSEVDHRVSPDKIDLEKYSSKLLNKIEEKPFHTSSDKGFIVARKANINSRFEYYEDPDKFEEKYGIRSIRATEEIFVFPSHILDSHLRLELKTEKVLRGGGYEALVESVKTGGAAEHLGLKTGDILTGFYPTGSIETTSVETMERIFDVITNKEKYERYIKVVRSGKKVKIDLPYLPLGSTFKPKAESLGPKETAIAARCENLKSWEETASLIVEVTGLKFDNPQDRIVRDVTDNLKKNDAGIKPGDYLVHVNGKTTYWIPEVLKGLCSEGSVLAVVERDDQYFETIISAGKTTLVDVNTTSFPVQNPFLADDGYYEPTWEAFFKGDFSKFDQGEKDILIVIANSAISDRFRYIYYDDEVMEAMKDISAGSYPCYPYGAEDVNWEQFTKISDRYGNQVNKYLSNKGTLYFDPRFSSTMLGKWEDTKVGLFTYKPVDFIIEKYGCYSAEYRMFYNRLFQLLK